MFLFKISIPIFIIIYLLVILYLKKAKHKSLPFLLFFSIMYIYLLGVVNYTIFPIPVHPEVIAIYSEDLSWSDRILFNPFTHAALNNILNKEALLNILLTIPFGFGVNFLINNKNRHIYLQAICFGVIIETIQAGISLCLQFPYRFISIFDIMWNFLGCILGYMIFLIFCKVIKLIFTKDDSNDNLLNFIKVTCKNY